MIFSLRESDIVVTPTAILHAKRAVWDISITACLIVVEDKAKMIIFDNIQKVRDEVAKYDRQIHLVAACKTQSKDTIDKFMSVAPDFVLGENRVQEFVEHYDEKYVWHIIGQLQTNKAKYIAGKVDLIHSLDRAELAKEIEKQSSKHGVVQKCLVEINMGAEVAKGGVRPEETLDFIQSMKDYPHIEIKGVMSVLPNLDDKVALAKLYDKLRRIFDDAKSIKQDGVDIEYMSAGMSNDYKIALEHGSNMIRLGRVLFGERIAPVAQASNN